VTGRFAVRRKFLLNPETMGRSRKSHQPPAFLQPMIASIVRALPEGDEWIYEVKLDGYRAIAIKDGERVQIRSRNNRHLNYPTIQTAVSRLRAESAVLDGEIVAVGADGRPSFQALQHPSAHRAHAIVFYAFDLLHLNGEDLTGWPLEQRKARLQPVLERSGIMLSQSLPGTAAQVIEAVGRLGLEGIIAKRRDSQYQPGLQSDAWVKLKLDRQQEFVIGGYRPGPRGVDSLLVGYYEGRKLLFAGKVRAGFTPHLRAVMFGQLIRLHPRRCPFVNLPSNKTSHWGAGVTAEQMSEMQWVRPLLVAQIRFVEWTADGHLRHAAFLGLREDKEAREVRREM
jgi:DNA ligase D-like protein (predicted ligase)